MIKQKFQTELTEIAWMTTTSLEKNMINRDKMRITDMSPEISEPFWELLQHPKVVSSQKSESKVEVLGCPEKGVS